MSARTAQLRREAEKAKKELVTTVGEFGTAVSDAKTQAVGQAKRLAPPAIGAVGSLAVLRLLLRRRKHRGNSN